MSKVPLNTAEYTCYKIFEEIVGPHCATRTAWLETSVDEVEIRVGIAVSTTFVIYTVPVNHSRRLRNLW